MILYFLSFNFSFDFQLKFEIDCQTFIFLPFGINFNYFVILFWILMMDDFYNFSNEWRRGTIEDNLIGKDKSGKCLYIVQEIVPLNFPEYSLMIKHCYVKVNVHRNVVTRLSVFITVSLVDNALETFVYCGYNFCQNIRIKEI